MTDISVKFPGGGPYMGVDPPGLPAGKVIFPPHLTPVTNTSTVTVTAAMYYIAPFFLSGKQTFAGALFQQGGVGDNGKKVKIGFFNATAGGAIGTLAKSFGEFTLDANATTKQLASSWTPARGWYWGEFVCDGTGVFRGMTPGIGTTLGHPMSNMIGAVIANAFLAENTGARYVGDTVAGTYANFPESTSLAPTASIGSASSVSFPAFGLYA